MKKKILSMVLTVGMLAGIITSLPVFATTTAEHFVAIYQAEDVAISANSSAIVTKTADGLSIAAGAPGNAVWGPYIALEAGATKITLRLRCPDVTFGGTTGVGDNEWLTNIAIFGPGGLAVTTTEAAGKYLPQFLAGEYVNFEFNFTATAGTYNPVIYTTGKKALFLDSITYDGYKAPSTPAMVHTTSIFQAEDVAISANSSAIVTKTADGLSIAAGTPGNAIWGPYVALEAGAAKITMRLRCPDVTFGGTTGVGDNEWLTNIAIYGPGGVAVTTTEAAGKYLPQFLAGEYVNFEFNFTATAGTYNPVIYTTGKKVLELDSVIYDLSNQVAETTITPTIDPQVTPVVSPTAVPVTPIVTSSYPIHYDFQGTRDSIGGYPHELQSDMYFATYTEFTTDGIVIPEGNLGNFIWGPYKSDLAAGDSFWTFKLKVDDNVPSDENIDSRFLRLVIMQKLVDGDWTEFKSIDDVYIDDFAASDTFQDFTIEAPITAGAQYSMAVYSAGFKTVTLKSLDIDDSKPEVPVNTTEYPVVYDFQGTRELISGYPHEIRSNLFFQPYVQFTEDGIVVPQGNAGNFVWGPYVTTLTPATTYWKFKMKIDDIVPSDENIDSRFLRIVIMQKLPDGAEQEFKSIDDVFIDDFNANDTFQDFVIETPITEAAQYSFVIYSAGFKTLTVNNVTITNVNPDAVEVTPTTEPTTVTTPTDSANSDEEIPETGDTTFPILFVIALSGVAIVLGASRIKAVKNNK